LRLDLPAQLNITCDRLANKAVIRALCTTTHPAGPQLLPFENIAIILDGKKVISGVSPAIRFAFGCKEARRFYTAARHRIWCSNMGGLGWSEEAFNEVDWKALERALNRRPNRFQLWLSKQAIGICATQKNTARIQDILDDRCPNCGKQGEDNKHLNTCTDPGQICLFCDGVQQLSTWMSN
jgi:hypothetical protein